MLKKRLLSIGINEYKSGPLDFCIDDARDILSVLSEQEFSFDGRMLLNGDATKPNIFHELDKVLSSKPDLFVFYFAGHGCKTGIGSYLVTYDGQPFEEGIDVNTMAQWLSRFSDAGISSVVLLDCCHAGATSPWPDRASPFKQTDLEATPLCIGTSRAILAACRSDQVSQEQGEIGHGLFTYQLLEGLLGQAADIDGRITVASLYDWVSRRFTEDAIQNPVFRADLASPIELGSGFPAISRRPATEEDIVKLEHDATAHIDGYVKLSNLPHDTWQTSGFNTACVALEPIIRWFERKIEEYPQLKRRQRFKDLHYAIRIKLAELANIGPNTWVSRGIIEKSLGHGSFGTVWKVNTINDNDNLFAYKVYHPQELNIEEKVGRFERGYKAMRQLEHPLIVKVRDFTNCPVGFYMDYINGPNLRQLAPGFGESDAIITALKAIAETIQFAHTRGIIHRDIKPENIVLSYNEKFKYWVPYLTDFDLAWFATATTLTQTGGFGTFAYAAPEQVSKPRSNEAHRLTVDIYGYGQLLYFAITQQDPIALGLGDNDTRIKQALEKWDSEKSAALILNLYKKCVEPNPTDRFSSFREVIDILGQALQGLTDSNLFSDDDQFIREIAFSMTGFTGSKNGQLGSGFVSLTGRTKIELAVKGDFDHAVVEIEAHLTPVENLMIQGVSSYEEARRIMNQRIDQSLSDFKNSRRRSGQHGSYEVFIDISKIPVTRNGVSTCRAILDRAVESMELI